MNFQLDYKMSSSRLGHLQLQSDIATQTVVFSCLNVKTNGFQFLPNDENEILIDTSSTRYLSSTRIEKTEGCDVSLFSNQIYWKVVLGGCVFLQACNHLSTIKLE